MRAERILTTATLTYVHFNYVVLLVIYFLTSWGRYREQIILAISPHMVASYFLTLILMVCYVANKRSDLRTALWKRIMLGSAIILTGVIFYLGMTGFVREYAA